MGCMSLSLVMGACSLGNQIENNTVACIKQFLMDSTLFWRPRLVRMWVFCMVSNNLSYTVCAVCVVIYIMHASFLILYAHLFTVLVSSASYDIWVAEWLISLNHIIVNHKWTVNYCKKLCWLYHMQATPRIDVFSVKVRPSVIVLPCLWYPSFCGTI